MLCWLSIKNVHLKTVRFAIAKFYVTDEIQEEFLQTSDISKWSNICRGDWSRIRVCYSTAMWLDCAKVSPFVITIWLSNGHSHGLFGARVRQPSCELFYMAGGRRRQYWKSSSEPRHQPTEVLLHIFRDLLQLFLNNILSSISFNTLHFIYKCSHIIHVTVMQFLQNVYFCLKSCMEYYMKQFLRMYFNSNLLELKFLLEYNSWLKYIL